MNKGIIIPLASKAISMNEIGGRDDLRYMFSDPDGVRSGKSGYSFGASQFDIENNWDALWILRECGLRPKDLDRLFEQRGDISDLNQKLKDSKAVIDRHDIRHIENTFNHCQRLIIGYPITLGSDEVMVHIMDYHNQFYMSPGGKLHRALRASAVEIEPKFMLSFKLNHTAWGQKRPDDVERRFRTIRNIWKAR